MLEVISLQIDEILWEDRFTVGKTNRQNILVRDTSLIVFRDRDKIGKYCRLFVHVSKPHYQNYSLQYDTRLIHCNAHRFFNI